jgi:two-component system, OmpR family, response regulator MtrA
MGQTNRVLVLCFDVILADLLGQILREDGYDVKHVRTLDGALSTLRLQAANLVIVDVDRWIEQETGSLLETLRSDPTANGIPVLILAHATDAPDVRRLLALYTNVRGLIIKPFDLNVFERETRKLLG